MDKVFPAIQILLSEGLGSRLYPAPREVNPDSRKVNFSTAAKILGLHIKSFHIPRCRPHHQHMDDIFDYMPRTHEELSEIMKCYEEVGLPGAFGSLDVVQKWSNSPAGDYNRAKDKESYPSLAFECITDFDRRILGVFGPQFGSQNDKHVVKLDPNIRAINEGRLSKINWQYYASNTAR